MEAKKISYQEFVEKLDFRQPASRVYKTVKKLITGKTDDNGNPPLTVNGEELVEEQEKANKAVDFVESVIGRPDDFKDDEKLTFAKVIRLSKIENDMDYNRYFTVEELKNVIRKLPLTAPGLDMIYPQYVKHLSDKWIKTLLEIINKAWEDGKFPKIWKDGVVTMIPKQGKDNSKMENLRMITLLPVLGKVYERMVKERLTWKVERTNTLKDVQCGFRKNRSTIEVLQMFVNDAVYCLENRKIGLAVFFDVSSAFDSVVHRHILEGVIAAKVRGRLLRFSYDYLREREVTVKVGKAYSERKVLRKRGVPQGSSLGPDYYNISEFDIPLDTGEDRAGIFADDNAMWIVCDSVEEGQRVAQEKIKLMETWAMENCVQFSVEKTKAMVITRTKKYSALCLFLNGEKIETVNQFKWLGITIDRKLTFKAHIRQLKKTCAKRLNIMKMLCGANFGPKPDFLMEFYIKYIRAKLEYGGIIYMAASKSLLEELETIQYSALRTAFGARKTTPRSFLESESGIEKLGSRRDIATLKFLRKTWISDQSNPIKSRMLKEGRLWCSWKKLFGIVRAKEIMEEFQMDCQLTSMLRVSNMFITPQWKSIPYQCNTEFEKWDNLDYDQSFKMTKEMQYLDTVDIFTDASKVDNRVGAAFVIPSKNIVKLIKLSDVTTVFQAEVVAIAKAVRYIIDLGPTGEKYRICSDSKSGLEAIKNIYLANKVAPEVIFCHEELQKLLKKGVTITLDWVPGHANINGNEMADTAAKQASTEDGQTFVDITPRMVNQIGEVIKKLRIKTFEDSRVFSTNMLVIQKKERQFEKKIYGPLSKSEARVIFRLRSGHAGIQKYRARFYNEDPRCAFCGNEETVEHLLFECTGTEDRRKNIRQFIREKRIRQSSDILSGAGLNSDCADGLKLICKFLKDINRIHLI